MYQNYYKDLKQFTHEFFYLSKNLCMQKFKVKFILILKKVCYNKQVLIYEV